MSLYADLYEAKKTTAHDAVASIADRSNLILGMSAAMPPALMEAVASRAKQGWFTNLNVYYMHASEAATESLFVPELMHVIKPHPLFMSGHDRQLAKQGYAKGEEWVHFVPCLFHQAGRLLTESISPDCFVVTVSPMDKAGYFSLGTNPDYGATVVRKAKRIIVEVNENMPRTFGESLLHISDIDMIVENSPPLMETIIGGGGVEDEKIAHFIAERIPDGATLQMGIGAVPNSVMGQLESHKDLGLHSELFSPPMVELIKKGVLNGRRKTLMPYKHVYTLALGDRDMFDFMDDNPSIVGYPVAWVNNPSVIRKNENMISVNAAIEVDFTGQVNSESIGGHQFSGTGGQLDFVRGAYAAPGGKSFIALHSTAKKGTVSRITPDITGGAITDPRMDVQYVVTEYGVADMKGRSLQERAQALINIAHPDFREELSRDAHDKGMM
ncbi:4-hydroxybutyrate coenzyme A transferase [Candidatus Terasakiella magnetica]|uniref:4-hydroxybutyrate coenzyme A transferase n=1 Tax=Candidatus Terasakiella magnetica TaxID=1867952 RepID=A0A1C3RFC6_9PROT|nr:acetyl-CoA hydrolase/transferase C-terminal domain-containing protein [Candidatus Terasakiella magnetica]SCA55955.1 4-hydroxybutyrate coenzyme A transferase [Candidatus Terasakiella magnetica]